jgi:hypothetical protein
MDHSAPRVWREISFGPSWISLPWGKMAAPLKGSACQSILVPTHLTSFTCATPYCSLPPCLPPCPLAFAHYPNDLAQPFCYSPPYLVHSSTGQMINQRCLRTGVKDEKQSEIEERGIETWAKIGLGNLSREQTITSFLFAHCESCPRLDSIVDQVRFLPPLSSTISY